MDVKPERRHVPGTAAPRPGEEGIGRLVGRKYRARVEIAGEGADRFAAPVIELLSLRVALAREAAEHFRPGIADEDDELRLMRHPILAARRKPAERREARVADGIEDRMLHQVEESSGRLRSPFGPIA